ncbi:MAG: autotransporter domain-containing protein [Betaproteobacteria bacterium]|nr:autotransporter domain-containing protein [Betaproteobacteria bacterium]
MKIDLPPSRQPVIRKMSVRQGLDDFRPRRTTIALAVCALLGSGGQAWAACTAAPSGAAVTAGVLAPASGDTVTCNGLNALAIIAPTATNTTVTVAAGGEVRSATLLAPAIALGAGSNISNDGTLFADRPGDGTLTQGGGTITIEGAGHTITNTGTIEARDGVAIQGNLFRARAAGVVLNNSGVIRNTNDTATTGHSAVNLGTGSQVTNSGQILMNGGGQSTALAVGEGSQVDNQATGVIRATETRLFTGSLTAAGVNGVSMGNNSTLVNAGRIEANAALSGNGTAVKANGKNVVITNTGIIDGSMVESAIDVGGIVGAAGSTVITNSGTLLGGSRGAIVINTGNGAVLTLDTGSQITGAVTARDAEKVPKSDAELGNSQPVIDFCRQNPTDSFCFKVVIGLPTQATLRLQGTGSEDDRISGFNLIEKLGAGLWTLNTPLQAGSADGTTGDFRGPLAVNVADAGGQLNLTGSISDASDGTAGQVVKNGAGILALSGNNTYSGATTINAGILQANGGNAIGDKSAVTIAGGALLQLAASETIGSLAGAGDVLLQNTALTTGKDNTSTTFSGSMIGVGSFEKYGTGTLTLTGASTATGDLIVQEGALNMAGSTPMHVAVSSGGSLAGNGTVGRLTNYGIVAPGNSVGTLNVNGAYLQASTGTYQAEIRPDGSAADLIAATGPAVLSGRLTVQGENGALLTPAAGGTAASPRLYTILTAGGGVSGQFGTTPTALGAFTFNTIYNPNNVQLGVTYAGFSAIQAPGVIPGTGTTNQKTKAKYLDSAPIVAGNYSSGNSDFDRILLEIANETPAQLANTYNAIIAEPYAAFMTVLLNQNDFYANTVMDRAQACSLRGRATLGGAFAPESTNGKREAAGCDPSAKHRRQGGWIDATWVRGSIDGSNGLSGYDYQMAGLIFGADTAVASDVAVGVAGGIGKPKLYDYQLAKAGVDGNSYFLSAYGTLTRDQWEFAGLLGYTYGNYDATRNITFGSINRQAKGDFDGQGMIASLKAAYFLSLGQFDLIPEVGLSYSKIWQDGFTESGAGSLNLRVDDASAHSVVTSVGARLGTRVELGGTPLRLQGLARYDYDWNAGDSNAHTVTASLAEVPALGSMSIVGQNRGTNGFTLGGAASALVTKNVDLFAGLTYRWNENGQEYTFGAGARGWW